MAFPDTTVLRFSYRVIQLNRLNWRDFIRRPNPVAAALMSKMRIAPEDRPRVKLEFLRMIATLRVDPARTTLLKTFMLSYLKLTREEELAYNIEYQRLDPAEKRAIVEVIDPWEAAGVEKGLRQGLQQGLARAALHLLVHRFGPMLQSLAERIEGLPQQALDDLMVALLDFQSIRGVEDWLAQYDSVK